MKLRYTNAGHNFPVLQRAGEAPELLKASHGLFLGSIEGISYKYDEVKLHPGDRLLLYTDGVTEANNTEKKMFGTDRLLEVMDHTREKDGKALLEHILDEVNGFAGAEPQFDDITMVVLTVKAFDDMQNEIIG